MEQVRNKDNIPFNRNMGFVSCNTESFNLPMNSKVDMDDTEAYLTVASEVIASGVPNYQGVWAPLPSSFDWDFLKQNMKG